MHQLLQTQAGGGSNTSNKFQMQSSIQLSDIISQSSFEIVKNLSIPVPVYLLLLIIEIGYMIILPAQHILIEEPIITESLLSYMQAIGIYIYAITVSALMMAQTLFLLLRGRYLKIQSTIGEDHRSQQSTYEQYGTSQNTIKGSGYFLTIISTAFSQFLMILLMSQFNCQKDYEVSYGCDSTFRMITLYISIVGFLVLLFLVTYSNFFLTKQFPDQNIPWAAWNDRSQFLRTIWKIIMVLIGEFLDGDYVDLLNFICAFLAGYIVYERFLKPSIYNRTIHIAMLILEDQLFIIQTAAFFTGVSSITLTNSGLLYCCLGALLLSFLQVCTIDKRESEVVSLSNDQKHFRHIFQIELYVVVMLHELQRLVSNEDYGQEKHIHAIVSKHMEDCENEACPCKNYEPEYDKKFTTIGSKRLTKTFSSGTMGLGGTQQSLQELKRLPYKVTYKTKVDIFKQEFAVKVDMFLENNPKSYGIKLLKSFFNHQFCDSSFKALFVQLENAATCKNFKGKVFIYHLKTQIQEEMKKSLESPLTIDINSLLKFEKFKIDFEGQLEELGYNCQTFWTDLTKEEYGVLSTLTKASTVAENIIKIKQLFQKLISINPSCIDTTSMYALAYRYILRDESTFSELVTRIQQIKNSFKLEQQRETGIKFFDADVYAVLLVSGDQKELGRIKQATSSTKYVFGYDPKDLIGSRINKLMPGPFAEIHDKFLFNFLNKGKSTYLEKNQSLPAITKEGFLQMTLFYIKPMVSLHIGLIITCFAKILNKYTLADESQDFVKLNKLCILLTDREGQICGMSETCSKLIGMPPPIAKKQLSINDNQPLNISQICSKAMIQEYEFELVKGCQLQVDTTCLNKERQFRREYPEFSSKIGRYQAEVGVHKFSYRDFKAEINIFVMKIADKDPLAAHRGNQQNDSTESRSQEDELTYSAFSITTANSSVSSSQVATSKFKTFKQKIQIQNMPSKIKHFQRLAYVIFILLISIAGGNFATNLIQNNSFNTNLNVLKNLQILLQNVPDATHSARQLILISREMVQTEQDTIIENQAKNKFDYYAKKLESASKRFESIQNDMKTILESKLSFESYSMKIKDVQTDGDIKTSQYSAQTSLNLLSSKILKMSTFKQSQLKDIIIPFLSLDWTPEVYQQYQKQNNINDVQQDIYFIIQNGLGSIVMGLKDIQQETVQFIDDSSKQAAMVAVILAGISICLIIILLPFSWPTLTHIEKISQLILMALNRLPEAFCNNETKACLELILFVNEQKEGEKSTHQMIKQHEHRKKNKEILKLPKKLKVSGSQSSNADSESDGDKNSLVKSKKGTTTYYDSKSTDSRQVDSASSSRFTSLSKIKQENSYQTQQEQQQQRVKRDVGGTIELELAQAKTSELVDEIADEDFDSLSEQEQKQKLKEKERKILIENILRQKKIKKFLFLILTSFIIAIYFGVTSFYLVQVHDYERHYAKDYQTIGTRIQCYTNVIAYTIDTLARGEEIEQEYVKDLLNEFVSQCYEQEHQYQQLLMQKSSYNYLVSDYIQLNNQFEGLEICSTLTRKSFSKLKCETDLNGILTKGLTETLFFILKNLESTIIKFDKRVYYHDEDEQKEIILELLKSPIANQIVSLHEIYLMAAFDIMREDSFNLVQQFFQQLNGYYNMLFGIFVTLLFSFQVVVVFYLVKRLSKEIIKMYHVVLLIPFSGRTQNDLNRLMMIKL